MRTVSTSSGVAALLAAAAAVILPHLLFRQKIEFLLSSPPSAGGQQPGLKVGRGARAYLREDEKADVVVMLGYALTSEGWQWNDGGPGNQGRVGAMIFSGGHPGGGLRVRSEAEVMEEAALSLAGQAHPTPGVWVLEEASRSTRENAVFSLRLAAEHGWGKVVVATSSFHQLRSWATFRCAAQDPSLASAILQIWMVRVDPWEQLEARLTEGDNEGRQGAAAQKHARGLWAGSLEQASRIWDVNREILALALYWVRGWLC